MVKREIESERRMKRERDASEEREEKASEERQRKGERERERVINEWVEREARGKRGKDKLGGGERV